MYAAFAEIQDLPTASYRTYATFAEVEDISKAGDSIGRSTWKNSTQRNQIWGFAMEHPSLMINEFQHRFL